MVATLWLAAASVANRAVAAEQTWRQVAILREGEAEPVRFVAVAPDGGRIATSGAEGVRIWDTADGKLVATLDGPRRGCRLIYSADGSRLMAPGVPTVVWDARDGHVVGTFRDRIGDVTACIAADGRHVITRSGFRISVLWDVETARRVKQLDSVLFGGSRGTIVRPEQWTLSLGGEEPNLFVQVFDLRAMRGLGVLDGADGRGMFCLDGSSADGKWLVTDWHEPGRR